MVVSSASLRNFRSHSRFDAALSPGVNLLAGPNGSGKTNVLEAIHFGLAGRSCRTSSDRQVITHGEQVARVSLELTDDVSTRVLATALDRSGERRVTFDGNPVAPGDRTTGRPPVIVFLPDRLSFVIGPPGGRRSHLDRLVAALKPSLSDARGDYSKALMQRNSLIASARMSGAPSSTLDAWDSELARAGSALVRARQEAVDSIAAGITSIAAELGLSGSLEIHHRPGGDPDAEAFLSRLAESRDSDLARGFTQFGPHRGDLVLKRGGLEIKTHSSQGEKRIALLALLLAERDAIDFSSPSVPVLLLDDVMSELDSRRRSMLGDRVTAGGQCVITATDVSHLPGAVSGDVNVIEIGPPAIADLKVA